MVQQLLKMEPPKSSDEYKNIAPLYDVVLGSSLLTIRKEVCRIARRRRFRNIVDICCGTGQQCIMLNELGFKVTGIDLSPGMIEVARRKSPKDIRYYVEDGTALHFDDHVFDCAILSFSLHEKDETIRGRIIEEALRVLTPDGRMILVDYLTPRHFRSAMASVFINVVERLAGKSHHRSYKRFMRAGALESLVAHHRLTATHTRKYHLGATALMEVERGR
jgi:demethylmenaquinone methyltransferase/2-methoxy-6-polyprenyl-1,4-benzoquinol methylase